VLVVVDLQTPHVPAVPSGTPVLATVFTKLDLVPQAGIASAAFLAARGLAQLPRPHFIVSNVAGVGLDALHAFLRGAATRSGAQHGAQRWRTHLAEALAGLERVPALAAVGAHDELAAAELAAALAALDRIEGRSSPEDVLDRVFARFCLGK
jgi:tRNA modification GTPase